MANPLTLSIGAPVSQVDQLELARRQEPAGVSGSGPPRPASQRESLAEICEILKRHEETLRDLIVEVRLLYHNLPENDRQRLEGQRERTSREVGDLFAGQVRLLDETIAAYRQAQLGSFGQSTAELERACSAAVSTLMQVMVDPNAPPAAKVSAADSVLGHAAKAIELREIEARLPDPQRAGGESKKGK